MYTINVPRSGQKRELTGKSILWRVLAGLAILTWGCTACQPGTQCPADEIRWFAATGHTVHGEFLCQFLSAGGSEVLGSPITEPFQQEGRTVQCFAFACLEDHPDNLQGPTIKFSKLGERLDRWQPALTNSKIPTQFNKRSHYFVPTGHAVRGAFLNYFEAHDGMERLGFPIGEPMVVNGQVVQDFQLSRLVWSADEQASGSVEREAIGVTWILRQNPDLLSPVPCPAGAAVEPAAK